MGQKSPVQTSVLPPTVFTNAVLIPLYASNKSVAGDPIFETIPCLAGYSDAVVVHRYYVSDITPYNQFTDAVSLAKQYLPDTLSPVQILNWPVLNPGSTFTDTSPNPTPYVPKVKTAWFAGSLVYFADFGNISNTNVFNGNLVSTGNAAMLFQSSGFSVGAGVLDVVDVDAVYTGFYYTYASMIADSSNYVINTLRSFDDLVGPYTPQAQSVGTNALNCPTTFAERVPYVAPIDSTTSTVTKSTTTTTEPPLFHFANVKTGSSTSSAEARTCGIQATMIAILILSFILSTN
ncbi:hypothetical protein BC830DRAFT_356460 [Chytriomyces sp. MP71]|nr:hypothetical protein BC830DRAFT_356460 [Chytriomyces sp. MP71]